MPMLERTSYQHGCLTDQGRENSLGEKRIGTKEESFVRKNTLYFV